MGLRIYQENGLRQLAAKIRTGSKRLVLLLPTGGGKTVMFAAMIARYIQRTPKNAIVLVHREELLKQARQKLYKQEGIIAEIVKPGVKHWPPGRVHVCMVETAFNRLKKKSDWFKNVGLVVIDEAHLDNFSKTMPYFNDCLVIGFTATALSSDKRKPLKGFYEDIVVAAQIDELIAGGSLCPNITFNAENISREELKTGMNDFNVEIMGAVYSTSKHVRNTVKAYEEHAIGQKTLIFNCNIDHSKLVHEAFIEAGYNSRHFDSEMPEFERRAILEWFSKTDDAILNNIGILTTGFDDPSIRWIIVNRATMSLSLWLQMNGRGSRPYPGKEFFGTIDMGNNWLVHGEWSTPRDWIHLFEHPLDPIEGGIGGVKECTNCHALIPVSAKTCKFCDTVLRADAQAVYDQQNLQFKIVSKRLPVNISVVEIVEQNKLRKSFYALHQIKHRLINHYRMDGITDEIAYEMLAMYQEKVEEWCRLTKHDYNMFMKEKSGQWFLNELQTVYSWVPPTFSLKF